MHWCGCVSLQVHCKNASWQCDCIEFLQVRLVMVAEAALITLEANHLS